MGKVVQTHRFGAHQVDVLEQFDDEGTSYLVLVDHIIVTDPPLQAPPGFEDVVRIYARFRQPGSDAADAADAAAGGASGGTVAGMDDRE